jgi:hypothetical protein
MTLKPLITAATVFAMTLAAAGQNLTVVSVSPDLNGLNAPITTPITVNFDRPILPASVTPASVSAFGRWSGPAEGTFTLSNADQTVTLTPDQPFSAGETVLVVLSHDLVAADGSPLRSAGYSFRFWTKTRPACMVFNELDVMSNRSKPDEQTRIYGAAASDLDNDGWLDIVTVNEVSADLRVFMNTDDGSGLFDPFLEPPDPGLDEMSPNETADFNHDGFSDLCVASTLTNNVLVFLGQGDGTFAPAQIIAVGEQPLGIAVLDFDGDGDLDIVNGNNGDSSMSRLTNNGSGVFGPPVFFEGGVSGEYGVASADMDRDGVMDVVVAGIHSQEIAVLRGNGNATFTLIEEQSSGGMTWQMGTGDINGDGWEDVHTSNSFSDSGSVLLNLGGGQLGPPDEYDTAAHTPATDLGDFDGDGDLDWLLSSFGAGFWRLYLNDGAGSFTISQDFTAPANPSCGTAMDLDNDRDLDIVLLDEIADVVILMENITVEADTNCDNIVNVDDLLSVINAWGPCPGPPPPCLADIAPQGGDGTVDVNDLLKVIGNWD